MYVRRNKKRPVGSTGRLTLRQPAESYEAVAGPFLLTDWVRAPVVRVVA